MVRDDEPAHSAVARASAMHGFGTPSDFGKVIGVDFDQLFKGVGLEHVAQLLGCDLERLRNNSPHQKASPRRIALCGEVFSNKHVLHRHRRWCEECWRDDVSQGSRSEIYHRNEWDVLALTSCARHGALFRSNCPQCGDPVLWRTRSLDRCQCGAALFHERRTDENDLSDPGSFQQYVRARLGSFAANSWLNDYPLWSLIGFVEGFGAAAIHGLSLRKPKLSACEVAAARDRGFEIVNDWPNGAISVFDSLLGDRIRLSGLTDAYGWMYAWLSSRRPDDLAVAALQVLTIHARQKRLIAESEDVLKPPEAGTISLFGASKVLGMSHSGARSLLTELGLIPVGSRRGVEFRIRRNAVLELAAKRNACVYQSGLGALLCIGKRQVDELVAAGGLQSLYVSTKGAPKLFLVADVNQLVGRLRAGRGPMGELDCTPLPAACQIARMRICDAIALILAGAVQSVPINGRGLRGVGVSWKELRALKPLSLERPPQVLFE